MSAYDNIISVGNLTISFGEAGRRPLDVPLHALEGDRTPGIDLFADGVVWEDEPARLSLTVESAVWLRKATLIVNDHNELWMKCDWLPDGSFAGGRTYRYAFVSGEAARGDEYRLPFAMTCGFARICVRLYLHDGPVVSFETPDVVCLDEPRSGGDGQHGERAEESNVRSMYQTLFGRRASFSDRQAAEWMFAPGMRDGAPLSSDGDTEWARAGLVKLLSAGDAVLDLVYDGIEDEADGFPSKTFDPAARSPYDTQENREVRALLASLARRAGEVADDVFQGFDLLERLYRQVTAMVEEQQVLRGRRQSLPVLELMHDQLDQERAWRVRALDLCERAQDALADLDAFVGGEGAVAQVAFALPPRTGPYAEGGRYEQLYEAMAAWDDARALEVERAEATFYALKPDRLFEYFALQHLLAGLYDLGFREDEQVESPLARYAYRLADVYANYRNEVRCANTYHLARKLASGMRQEVRLYYQPVIYEEGPAENGVCLRRLSQGEAADVTRVWTPDYLLAVRSGSEVRWHVIDAKYRKYTRLEDLRAVLATCMDKYLAHTRVAGDAGLVDGVWVLSGRLPDAAGQGAMGVASTSRVVWSAVRDGLVPADALPEGTDAPDVPCGIVSWNRNTGSRKVRAFLGLLGLARG